MTIDTICSTGEFSGCELPWVWWAPSQLAATRPATLVSTVLVQATSPCLSMYWSWPKGYRSWSIITIWLDNVRPDVLACTLQNTLRESSNTQSTQKWFIICSNINPGALRGAQQHGFVNNLFRGCIYFKSRLIVFKLSGLLAAIGCMYERILLGRLALCLRVPFGVDWVNTCERSPV